MTVRPITSRSNPGDPSNFTKHRNQFCNVGSCRHFQTDLPRILIVTLAEVGRRRDTGVGNADWHQPQCIETIAKVAAVNQLTQFVALRFMVTKFIQTLQLWRYFL